MNLRNLGIVVLSVAVLQGVALAEMISGTISGIDPQSKKMTLVRQDNPTPLTLKVKDQAQLLGLQPGNKVVVDANRRMFGGWNVESVTMATGTSAGNEANLNAAERSGRSDLRSDLQSSRDNRPSAAANTPSTAVDDMSRSSAANDLSRSSQNPDSNMNATAGGAHPQDASRTTDANPTADKTY